MIPSEIYRQDIHNLLGIGLPWDRLSGHRVLVTGATGLIGSIVADVLAAKSGDHGFEVTAMSRNMADLERLFGESERAGDIRLVEHDVNEPLDLGCDTVFHLASNTHPRLYQSDPIGTIATNVVGLRNLLDMVSANPGGRFVFASSVEIYGQNRGDVELFDEQYCGYIDCNTVRAGYNESKRVGEALCQAYGAQRGVDFVIPRLSRVYGPSLRHDDSKAMSQFLSKAAAGEEIVLKSKGDQLFSYCYSADAAAAMLFLLFNGAAGEAYNVSGPSDSNVTLRGIAEKLAGISGTNVVFQLPEQSEASGYSKATKALLDTRKISELGWKPRYGLDEGLLRTVRALARE